MKILYFSFVELDIPNACAIHTLGILQGFSNNGCRVDALIPKPISVKPDISNVTFYYLWPWRFSFVGRIWVKLLSSFLMFFLCFTNRYDAIYVREMETHPGYRLCSKWFRIPLYIEINDLIVLVSKDKNQKYSSRIELQQKLDFKCAAGLIVPSVPMREWIIDYYNLPAEKVHLVFNGTENINSDTLDKKQIRKTLKLPENCFCLLFLGILHKGFCRYDYKIMLKAFKKCSQKIPEFYLLFIGDGSMRKDIERELNKMGLKQNAIFTGFVPSSELGKFMPACNAGLIISTKKDVVRYGPISTKLSTYGAFKIPVIATGYHLNGYPKELSDGILLVEPESANALENAIYWLYENSQEARKKGITLKNFIKKNMTWDATSKQIVNHMSKNSRVV